MRFYFGEKTYKLGYQLPVFLQSIILMAFYEHNKRSITKALTFRGVILVSDGIIIFLITHRYDVTLAMMLFFGVTHTIFYFFHERVWNKIHWGKNML